MINPLMVALNRCDAKNDHGLRGNTQFGTKSGVLARRKQAGINEIWDRRPRWPPAASRLRFLKIMGSQMMQIGDPLQHFKRFVGPVTENYPRLDEAELECPLNNHRKLRLLDMKDIDCLISKMLDQRNSEGPLLNPQSRRQPDAPKPSLG